MRLVLSILLAVTLGGGPVLAGPLEDGLAAYKKGAWDDAVRLLKPLAEQGNPQAAEKLGRLYERGKGVKRDYAAAEQWYGKAAALGDAEAEARYAFILYLGIGGKRDFKEAFRWYQASAAQGNALGQVGVGIMSMEGVAAPIDYKAASEWFLKAAAQGNAFAMASLGSLYENGRGVPKDLVQAYAWYSRATIDDGEYEPELFARAKQSREEVAKRMTAAQIDEARGLAARKL